MVAMVAMVDEAILELEEPVSTKVIAPETTVAKLTAVVETKAARLVKRKPTTLVKSEALAKSKVATTVATPTTHTCIHC